MDKGPQNPKTTLPVDMYTDQDGNLRHLPAYEIWWRRDRSTGGMPEQSTKKNLLFLSIYNKLAIYN
jgi:hypothetical protein